jgi:hypothetical protein
MLSSHRTLLAGCALATALLLSAAIAASASPPLKITNCTSAVSRPKQITLTCADANTALEELRWASFGGKTANGTGRISVNTCQPNCAAGKSHSYAVRVQATSPRSCKKGVRVYDKLALTFLARAPKNSSSLTHWTLGCPF